MRPGSRLRVGALGWWFLVLAFLAGPSGAAAASTSTRTCRGSTCTTTVVDLAGRDGDHRAEGAGGCPDVRTCDRFELLPERWPLGPDGRLTIPYVISEVDHPYVSSDQLRLAAARMSRVWEAANPAVRFVDEGTSPLVQPSAGLEDGRNSIGFGPIPNPTAIGSANIISRNGVISEIDITLQLSAFFTSAPCEQADGACAGAGGFDLLPGTTFAPVETVLVHELGHGLGLSHPIGDDVDDLTMHGTTQNQEHRRIQQTLGLGDVLGVRAAIPCSDCQHQVPQILVP